MRARDDEGAATALVLALCGVLLALSMVVVSISVLVVTRHRAEAAADLAALSAARHAHEGEVAACAVARAASRRHGARLDACRLVELDVLVHVSQAPPGRLASFGRLRASARAGAR